MREKDFNTGLRGVLFEAGHYARMGPAVWLYGWMVLRQTHQSGGIGYVLGGSPLTYREIEEETGFNRRTLEAWMRTLRREGYIETRQDRGGIVVLILKAKKHRKPTSLTLPTPRQSSRATNIRGETRADAVGDPEVRETAEAVRRFAGHGPSNNVASASYTLHAQSFAAPNGSSSVVEISKTPEAQVPSERTQRASSLCYEETKAMHRTSVEKTNPQIKPSGLETNQTTSRSFPTCEAEQGISRTVTTTPATHYSNVQTTTPSLSHGFARAYNPHETKVPWELRKRMQLERAAREEELRRELYVGTGPEARRT